MNQATRRIIFHGHVQGVGFRATTNRLARGFAVSGFVRNLPDGTVEVVATGDADEVDRFADAIRRKIGGKIRDVENSEYLGETIELSGFSVRY